MATSSTSEPAAISSDPIANSPFFNPGLETRANSLAIVQLSRDDYVPVFLSDDPSEHDGYKEGHVLNTKFGSFPHSTLIGIPWGSQVRATNVDTGSRGRNLKRKRGGGVVRVEAGGEKKIRFDVDTQAQPLDSVVQDEALDASTPADSIDSFVTKPPTASSGFIHVLPPTPEIWTSSLPHRTQVVYIPDYSYILHRIRARPGTRLIESGTGSGSFTHAAARAVYDGKTGQEGSGKVFTFEFNQDRYKGIKEDVVKHGLEGLVEAYHRDAYKDGFGLGEQGEQRLGADAVFLDLPAPWLALKHLVRRKLPDEKTNSGHQEAEPWISPLNPHKSVHICTFSPCIEQVTRTVAEMRKLGWMDIEMVEVDNRKIHLQREIVGLDTGFQRGVIKEPKDVEEALARLQDIEERAVEHQASIWKPKATAEEGNQVQGSSMDVDPPAVQPCKTSPQTKTKQQPNSSRNPPLKPWTLGTLTTRTEPELKTHTSYLVFAILPVEWTDEDEAEAAKKWPIGNEIEGVVIGTRDKKLRKIERREMLEGKMRDKERRKQKEGRKHEPRLRDDDISGAGTM